MSAGSEGGKPRASRRSAGATLELKRALRLAWTSAPGWTAASATLVVLQGLLPLVSLYLTKLIVDAVVTGVAAPDRTDALRHVLILVGLAGLTAVVLAVTGAVMTVVNDMQALVVTDHVNDLLHGKAMEVDLAFYEDPSYYDILHRARQEAPYRPTSIVRGLAQAGQNAIALIGILALLLSLQWTITLLLLVAALPAIYVRWRYSNVTFAWQRERTATERRAWYFSWMLTADLYAKEVRLFGLGPYFRRQFSSIRSLLRSERLQIARRRAVGETLAQSLALLPVFGAFAYIADRALHNQLSIGGLVMYYQAFQRGQGSLRDLAYSLAGLYEDNLFLTYLFRFLDLKGQTREPAEPVPFPRPLQEGLRVSGVSFHYPTSERPALDNVDIEIRPGERIAIVGRNGSGKTTLLKLLFRMYDASAGRISYDGIDVRQFDSADLRRQFSVVFQDYACYNVTAGENIRYGDIEAPAGEGRVEEAARRSGADEVIGELPRGYDTVLGKWFEEGEQLSTGQWQKVALARAFMRDAQMIILDEPTSSMDALSELELFERFFRWTEGKTAIIVSHRMSTVRMADRIYVLDRGRIVESGTHESLIRHNGEYARLFETQASYYV